MQDPSQELALHLGLRLEKIFDKVLNIIYLINLFAPILI
jgi:hypothetical protein